MRMHFAVICDKSAATRKTWVSMISSMIPLAADVRGYAYIPGSHFVLLFWRWRQLLVKDDTMPKNDGRVHVYRIA